MSRSDRPDADSAEYGAFSPEDGAQDVSGLRRRFALWHSLSFWRQWGLGASLAAAALLAVVVFDIPSRPHRVAVLQSGEDSAAWLISVDTVENALSIRPVAGLRPNGRSYQLWAIPRQGNPLSLGVIPASRETTIPIDIEGARAIAGADALAISLEEPGGSPTGKPAGPLLFRGKLLAIAR